LPSGRYPPNYKWAGKLYRGKHWTKAMAKRFRHGVRFNRRGYPNFWRYAQVLPNGKKSVTLPRFRVRATDFAAANRACGWSKTPRGFTWHHHENGRSMLLVPTRLHAAIPHAGGFALRNVIKPWKRRFRRFTTKKVKVNSPM
jgi:hypothetical protein